MTEQPLVPARQLHQWTFCPRLGILEWVQAEFLDNAYTVEGTSLHRRVDRPGAPLPIIAERAASDPNDAPPRTTRSVYLESEREHLVAKMDLVEVADGSVIPVDTKRGRPPRPDEDPTGMWPPDRIQLGAQALLLRDHGYRCERALIFYATPRRRVEIVFTDNDFQAVRDARDAFLAAADAGVLPPPLVHSPKCGGCSLAPICLPDETLLLRHLQLASGEVLAESLELPDPDPTDDEPSSRAPLDPSSDPDPSDDEPSSRAPLDPSSDPDPTDDEPSSRAPLGPSSDPDPLAPALAQHTHASTPASPRIRPLFAGHDPGRPLYLTDSASRLGVRAGLFTISKDDHTLATVRVRDTSSIAVFGRAHISSMALREAFDRALPVAYFTAGGYFVGTATGPTHKNVLIREHQFRTAFDPDRSLAIAKALVRSKIRNQRTLLRRNGVDLPATTLRTLARLADDTADAPTADALLGLEGAAAALYFRDLPTMLKPKTDAARLAFDFTTRNRRPPRDPVNALLSACYAFLTRDCFATLQSCGFDPYLGVFHRPRYGKPALALDLMEEFRPLIADSVVLSVINQGELIPASFIDRADGCNLTDFGRKVLLTAYERRMQQELLHPLFGYRVSWRRVIELQARLLGRVMSGELPTYHPIETR